MTSDNRIFMRLIEIDDPYDHFQFKYGSGGSWEDVNLTKQLYESALDLINEIHTRVVALEASVTTKIDVDTDPDNHYFRLYVYEEPANATDFYLKFTSDEEPLANLLGLETTGAAPWTFSSASSGGTQVLYGDHNLAYCWFPYRLDANNQGWRRNMSDNWRGVTAGNGRIVGVEVEDAFYQKEFHFPFEPAHNVYRARARNDYEDVRCAEYFFDTCRTVQIVDTASANPRGFWYVHDATEWDGTSGVSAMDGADDGIHFSYSSSPNKYVFCSPPPTNPINTNNPMSRGTDFADVVFRATTADYPS